MGLRQGLDNCLFIVCLHAEGWQPTSVGGVGLSEFLEGRDELLPARFRLSRNPPGSNTDF